MWIWTYVERFEVLLLLVRLHNVLKLIWQFFFFVWQSSFLKIVFLFNLSLYYWERSLFLSLFLLLNVNSKIAIGELFFLDPCCIFTLYTGIMSSTGYNCENVYNHKIFINSLLLVQHLPNCLIWLEVKKIIFEMSNIKSFNRICRSAIRI